MSQSETSRINEEKLKIALSARDFEIRMFWQRCNYFLLLNSAVGAAAGAAIAAEKTGIILIILCAVGAFVCLAWIKVGLGAKFWQTHWEGIVVDFQGALGLTADDDIFSTENMHNRVGKCLEIPKEKGEQLKNELCFTEECKKFFRLLIRSFSFTQSSIDFYNEEVYRKPSVSGWMHKTACFFFLVWVVAFAIVAIVAAFACWA